MIPTMNTNPLICPDCGQCVEAREVRTVTTITESLLVINTDGRICNSLPFRPTNTVRERHRVQCGCEVCPFVFDAGVVMMKEKGDGK